MFYVGLVLFDTCGPTASAIDIVARLHFFSSTENNNRLIMLSGARLFNYQVGPFQILTLTCRGVILKKQVLQRAIGAQRSNLTYGRMDKVTSRVVVVCFRYSVFRT